jgi:hypothetical protein
MLELTLLPAQGIRFTSWVERDAEALVLMCAWCKRIAVPGSRWLEVEEALQELRLFDETRVPKISHGVCTDCKGQVMESLMRSSMDTQPG